MKAIQKTAFFFVFQFSCLSAIPQQPSYINYNQEDGLLSKTVYGVLQDSTGYLWFATDHGVSKYDGYEFTNYTTHEGLSDNEILSVHEDSRGRIWFLPFNGQLTYYKDGEIHNAGNTEWLRSIKMKGFFNLFQETRNGDIWISCSKQGMLHLSPSHPVKTYDLRSSALPVKAVNHLWEDTTGNIWIAAPSGFFKWETDRFKWIKKHRLRERSYLIRFGKLASGAVLFVKKEGAYVFNTQDTSISMITSDPGMKESTFFVSGLTSDILWLGTQKGAKKIHYTDGFPPKGSTYLSHHQISSVFEDREGNHWFTTLNNGIFFTSSLAVLSYNQNTGLPANQVNCIGINEAGTIWLGQEKATLSRINNGSVKSYQLPSPKGTRMRIKTMIRDKNRIWAGSDFGLIKIDKDTFRTYHFHVRDLDLLSDQFLIVGNENGIHKFRKDAIPSTNKDLIPYIQKNRIYHKPVTAIAVDPRGNIWMGQLNGLAVMKGDSIADWSNRSYPLQRRINDIKISEKNLKWVATDGAGVVLISQDTIININTTHGLPNDYCNQIFMEDDRSIWVATDHGLSNISLSHPAGNLYTIQNYFTPDGLASNIVYDVIKDDHKLYIATYKGLTILDEENINPGKTIPSIFITEFKTPLTIASKFGVDLSFPFDQNNIKIKFKSLHFRSCGNLLYQYRLLGLDTTWKYTKLNIVRYPFLLEGDYSFQVRAQGMNGIWSDETATLDFTIQPPFWRSWWFRLLLFAAISGLIYVVFKIRLLTYNRDVMRELIQTIIKKIKKQQFLFIKVDGNYIKIEEEDILYIQAALEYVEIITVEKKYLAYSSMTAIMDKLPTSTDFLRVHRSYIVRLDKIEALEGTKLRIKDNLIPVGKTYLTLLKSIKEKLSIK